MAEDRQVPHDLDAEESVLGSLLIDPDALHSVATLLRPEDFFRDKNRWVYEACLELFDRGEAINQVTVGYELSRRARLEEVGGPAYLSGLVSQVPTSVHIRDYGQIVYRLAMMRRLIGAAHEIEKTGYAAGPDVEASLSQAEDILFRLRRGEGQRDFVHIRQVLNLYLEESEPRPRDGYLPQVPTGFTDLDRLLGGLQRSDMIVVAARTSLGKTSLALNIARNAALDYGARVALFSLEMSRMELAYRFLSSESGVDTQRLRQGQASQEQRDAVAEATGTLSEAAIYIDDSPLLRDTDMRSKARRLHLERHLDLVIVDYLQLMRSSRFHDNRVQEMSDISQAVKALARDLAVPVVAVSQLSRAVEQRPSHTPQLSDLRDSGSIEQDADVVIFIYRDDAYYTPEQWEKLRPGDPYPKGIAELHIAKHRNGPTGRVNLFFQEKTAKFANLERSR